MVRIHDPQPTFFAMKYTVILEKGRESGFVATVPALRGCVSQGASREETLANVREAIEVYLEALHEDGLFACQDAE